MIKWTEDKVQFLKEFTPGHSYMEITEQFNKTFNENVPKTTISSAIKRYDLKNGIDATFKKGKPSANKGRKMPPEVYEKCKATMFKKGKPSANTLPIGTEKMLEDGYVWVKFDNKPHVKKIKNWKQKHRIVYEEYHNVKLTEDELVIFLDGNHENFDIENLKKINRHQNLILNKKKLRFDDAELTNTGTNIAAVLEKISDKKKRGEKEK